ncbi:putative leader peptide [Streptomyces sp. NPDC001848]|uniref:putative leader peptide n=1 Tax=Streptomyces sp. NPDC001848 TaxID=3364618 RepID=UPI0036AE1A9D
MTRAGRCEGGDVHGAVPRTEVTDVTRVPSVVRLHSRPHIDLLRVAAALCCS